MPSGKARINESTGHLHCYAKGGTLYVGGASNFIDDYNRIALLQAPRNDN